MICNGTRCCFYTPHLYKPFSNTHLKHQLLYLCTSTMPECLAWNIKNVQFPQPVSLKLRLPLQELAARHTLERGLWSAGIDRSTRQAFLIFGFSRQPFHWLL